MELDVMELIPGGRGLNCIRGVEVLLGQLFRDHLETILVDESAQARQFVIPSVSSLKSFAENLD